MVSWLSYLLPDYCYLITTGSLIINIFLCYHFNVRIFKYQRFSRFAGKEGITVIELREIVNRLEKGQADADLGAGVYKVRVARPGEGKSGVIG